MTKITTTIRIKYETYDYIKRNSINLSKFIEESIYDSIKKEGSPKEKIKLLNNEIKQIEHTLAIKKATIKQIKKETTKEKDVLKEEVKHKKRLDLIKEREEELRKRRRNSLV